MTTTATAYNLSSFVTWSPQKKDGKELRLRPRDIPLGCIALSRKLAKDLGLKKGPGRFDYAFGQVIEVSGIGSFIFADLMPERWSGYRVDIFYPTLKQCHIFGVRRCQVWRVE